MSAEAEAPTPALSLYIHVPFCRARCRYCAFSARVPAPGEREAYLPALLAEIDLWAERLGRVRVPTLYLGGGTPSLLPPRDLERLLAALRARFDLAPDAEISLEANPDSATPELLRAARSLGVTRLSLGVQSFRDEELALLGRVHSARQAREAAGAARSAGFKNLSLDLIWGLPGQRESQWLESLRQAVEIAPEHLSCYGLTLEPGTPLAEDMADNPDAEAAMPTERELARMFLHTGELLEQAGYMQDEISNYSRLGHHCRYNQACWDGLPYLGLGPAAASTLGGVRFTNPEDPARWAALVREGLVGTHQREALSPRTLAQERLMLALRTAKGLDLAQYHRLSGVNLSASHAAMLQALRQKELIRLNKGRLRLTRAGMLVSNSIIRALAFD